MQHRTCRDGNVCAMISLLDMVTTETDPETLPEYTDPEARKTEFHTRASA